MGDRLQARLDANQQFVEKLQLLVSIFLPDLKIICYSEDKSGRDPPPSNLLVLNILIQQLQFLPELRVLLLPHELDQLPLGLQFLLDGAEVSDFLLGSVLQLLEMFARVLLRLKSNKNPILTNSKTDRRAQLFLTFIARIIYSIVFYTYSVFHYS